MTVLITLFIPAAVVAAIVGAAQLVGWNLTEAKLLAISKFVYDAVRAAEQQLREAPGKDKKSFVLELVSGTFGKLAEKYEGYISVAVEAEVWKLKDTAPAVPYATSGYMAPVGYTPEVAYTTTTAKSK